MELAILHTIQEVFGHPALDVFMAYFTQLGQVGILWIVVGLILVAKKEYRIWGVALLVSLLMVTVFNEGLLKFLIARQRPFVADPSIELLISAPMTYSFPSGHTGTAFAAATVLTFSPIARGWKVAAWIAAVLLAFSRLYLYVHYPTDVLAGAILGALYGFIAVKVVLAVHAKRAAETTTL